MAVPERPLHLPPDGREHLGRAGKRQVGGVDLLRRDASALREIPEHHGAVFGFVERDDGPRIFEVFRLQLRRE